MDDDSSVSAPQSEAPPPDAGPQGHSMLGKVARAAFIILFFQVFWKLGGFLLNVLVGWFWGPSVQADAYLFVGENVIFLLQTLCLKVAIPVIVPVFKAEREKRGEESAWHFLNTVINMVLVIQVLVMLAGMVYASEFVALTGQGFNRETERLATLMMRWSMPGVFLISFATVTYAILNSYNEFGHAAAGDAAQKILWASTFLVLGMAWSKLIGGGTKVPVQIMIISFLVGAAGNIGAHLVGLRSRLRLYRPAFAELPRPCMIRECSILLAFGVASVAVGAGLAGGQVPMVFIQAACATVAGGYLLLLWWRARKLESAMARFAALAVPLLFGILFAKYRDVFSNYFATFTGRGGFTDLKLARKIGELPNTLIAQAIGVAILPYLCELAQQKKWGDFEQAMTRTLKVMLLIFLPLTVATVILRTSLIDLLLNGGDWGTWHLQHAGNALGFYILALTFFAIENPLQQSYFSMQRMWVPTFIGIGATVFHMVFLYFGIRIVGWDIFVMSAIVYPVVRILKGCVLIGVMRTIVPILPLKSTGLFLGKVAVCCGVAGGAMWWTHALTTGLFGVDSFRSRRVMTDTFNVEAPSWNSENMVEFEIAPGPGEDPGNCLRARYVPSSRRRAVIRRDVTDLKLAPDSTLKVRVRANRGLTLAAQLTSRTDEIDPPVELKLEPDTWTTLPYQVTRAPATGNWELLQLWDASSDSGKGQTEVCVDALLVGDSVVDDFEPTAKEKSWRARGGLDVVDLYQEDLVEELKGWELPQYEAQALARNYPRRARQQIQVVDWIDRHEPELLKGDRTDYLRKAIKEDLQPPAGFRVPDVHVEYCLLPTKRGQTSLVIYRSLAAFRLGGQKWFSFKAKSESHCKLKVSFLTTDPQSFASAEFSIKATNSRAKYRMPLNRFSSSGEGFSLDDVTELRIEELDDSVSGRLWLDNFEFVRPVSKLRFKFGQVLHCVIPTIIGGVIFLLLLRVLRVEEAHEIAEWLKENGMAKVRSKLRKS